MPLRINNMIRIKNVIKVSVYVTVLSAIIFLFIPMFGYLFSLGIIIGGLVALFDFWLIIGTVGNLKKSMEDSSVMLRFGLLFVAKTIFLLLLLAAIVFVLARIGQIITFGFLAGLFVIPLSIFITAFSKPKEDEIVIPKSTDDDIELEK